VVVAATATAAADDDDDFFLCLCFLLLLLLPWLLLLFLFLAVFIASEAGVDGFVVVGGVGAIEFTAVLVVVVVLGFSQLY
jgi:hypothetical protein